MGFKLGNSSNGCCWNLSQIPLPILQTIKLFLFEDYCLTLKTQGMVENFLFYENYFIFIFLVEDLFYFWKDDA